MSGQLPVLGSRRVWGHQKKEYIGLVEAFLMDEERGLLRGNTFEGKMRENPDLVRDSSAWRNRNSEYSQVSATGVVFFNFLIHFKVSFGLKLLYHVKLK